MLEEWTGGVFPGRAATRLVQIENAGATNLALTAEVNGAQVAMVLDTGATSVVLTQEAAKAAGLPVEVLAYTATIETANGRARAAPVTLDRIAIGRIVERAVPALIMPPGQLRTSLLGMSFLSRLQSWEVRGERLVIRGYP
jgi:aspartyl protease family protein